MAAPPPLVARLDEAVDRAPDLAETITSQGKVIGGGTPEQLAAFIAAESARWSKVVREKDLQAD